ncbi:chorismate mutase [Sulfolobales archaeon HS-7]|nr:chorismate mutase [Sulfolobales archaeon HS-7]
MKELEELRTQIDYVDEEIVKLIAERLKLSEKIGHIKASNNLEISDYKREESVINRWKELSRLQGVPEALSSKVIEAIIPFSRAMQVLPNEKKSVLIIGYGNMAQTIGRLVSYAGHKVMLSGVDPIETRKIANSLSVNAVGEEEGFREAEYVIFTLPPKAYYTKYFKELLKFGKGKDVSEISSSKTKTFPLFLELSKKFDFNYVSIHPLFGPMLLPIGEKIAIIIDNLEEVSVKKYVEFWRGCGLSPVSTHLEEHERTMAVTQSLVHFYMIALIKAIEEARNRLGKYDEGLTTTNFSEMKKLLQKISEILPVILEIQEENPYSHEVRLIGVRKLVEVAEALGSRCTYSL